MTRPHRLAREETRSYALLVGLVGLGNMVACTLGGGRSVSTPG